MIGIQFCYHLALLSFKRSGDHCIWRLDLMILEVFSNLNDSVIL